MPEGERRNSECYNKNIRCRSYEGDYSSFIWSGSEYRYNPFFYMLGLALFVGFMIIAEVLVVRKKGVDLGNDIEGIHNVV